MFVIQREAIFPMVLPPGKASLLTNARRLTIMAGYNLEINDLIGRERWVDLAPALWCRSPLDWKGWGREERN
jgi:hypothetical protein